jgi:hypothetical protein
MTANMNNGRAQETQQGEPRLDIESHDRGTACHLSAHDYSLN